MSQKYAGSFLLAVEVNVTGGNGDDFLEGGPGASYVDGRAGNDELYSFDWLTFDINAGGDGALDTLVGGSGNDTLLGDSDPDLLIGGTGDDALFAGVDYPDGDIWSGEEVTWPGNDTLDGGAGADYMSGSGGDDLYYVDNIGDRLHEAAEYDLSELGYFVPGGHDTVSSSINYVLGEAVEDLILTGSATTGTGNELANDITGNSASNVLSGLAGNDTLRGGGGSDSLYGQAGTDTMYGDAGDDFYYVDVLTDKVTELSSGAAGGKDTVYATSGFTLSANVETLFLVGGTAANATGNNLGNAISGNSYVNTVRGLAGADTIQSGNGADIVIAGTGNDVFKFQSVTGSNPAARDILRAGDGAAAFERAGSEPGDKFDLSLIDANTSLANDQAFLFGITTGIGHVWVTTSGSNTLINGNTDADSVVEFQIAIEDGSVLAAAYKAVDFIL